MGHHLAVYLPECFAAALRPDPVALAELLHAALRLADAVDRCPPAVEALSDRLAATMVPAQRSALRGAAAELAIDAAPDELHATVRHVAERWLVGMAHTRARTGLSLADELATAHRMLDRVDYPWRSRATHDDLDAFWLFDDLSTLRRALGW